MEYAFSAISSRLPYYVFGTVLAFSIPTFLFRLYIVRKRTYDLQRQGLVSDIIATSGERMLQFGPANHIIRPCRQFIQYLGILLF